MHRRLIGRLRPAVSANAAGLPPRAARPWLAIAGAAYVVFLVASFPAGTAQRWFAPEALRFDGVDGTIWTGSADLASLPGMPMRDLRWNLDALPLLLGRISVQFEARLADGSLRGAMAVSPGAVSVADLQASANLALLDGALKLGGVQGLASLNLQSLELEDGWPTAVTGSLRIEQLRVPPLTPSDASAAPIPFGNFEVTLSGVAGRSLLAVVQDAGGPLEIAAELALELVRPYSLAGAAPSVAARVRERPDAPGELAVPLNMLTVATDTEGWRTLDLDPWLTTL